MPSFVLAGLFALGLTGPVEAPQWTATAYCKGQITASGKRVERGMAAADRRIIPLGSLIRVDARGTLYDGLYRVEDTGSAIKGHIIDLYMWSCWEALEFGRQKVQVEILRRGRFPSAPRVSNPLR